MKLVRSDIFEIIEQDFGCIDDREDGLIEGFSGLTAEGYGG